MPTPTPRTDFGPPPFDGSHNPDPEKDDERIDREHMKYILQRGYGKLFGLTKGNLEEEGKG